MSCTTILVGKNASYDGSTLMARNEDSGSGHFEPKKFVSVTPEKQPRSYRSKEGRFRIQLPDDPMRYTSMPNADPHEGLWAEAGFNAENVAMSATETITTNPRVQGADPMVPTGIGEEDLVTCVLPYIHSAREGVLRLGKILEEYGTYEPNGIGFQDVDEIWWMETIGGHHFIAKRCPDNAYVVGPNQQGIDSFDFTDAYGAQKDHICSPDMAEFIEKNHLDLAMTDEPVREQTAFAVRPALGSHDDSDHTYNSCRAWFMERYLNPRTFRWDGPDADYTAFSDDIPWCMVPEHKVTLEEIKYVLSSHYQGTDFDPYSKHADPLKKGMFRPIGVNRVNFMEITQMRPYVPAQIAALSWICTASNAFNAIVPFYANVNNTPAYLKNTGKLPTTESFYWANRYIGALADAAFHENSSNIERYQVLMACKGHELINRYDAEYLAGINEDVCSYLEKCNQNTADLAKKETYALLDKVLYTTSLGMKNKFARSDS